MAFKEKLNINKYYEFYTTPDGAIVDVASNEYDIENAFFCIVKRNIPEDIYYEGYDDLDYRAYLPYDKGEYFYDIRTNNWEPYKDVPVHRMKIVEVKDSHIKFSDGSEIEFWHEQECCEHNWADCKQIDDIGMSHTYMSNLIFEEVPGSGFRFGNRYGLMTFVPCYSDQNGYYSSRLNVAYNGITVCKMNKLGCSKDYDDGWGDDLEDYDDED